jgi:hypothetical protein
VVGELVRVVPPRVADTLPTGQDVVHETEGQEVGLPV